LSSAAKRRKEASKTPRSIEGVEEALYRDGEVIFREGDRSLTAFVVASGRVELIKSTVNGPVRLALLGPGEVFGEMGVIDISVRSTTARAVGDTVVEVVDRKGFVSYLQSDPDVAMQVIGTLSERLRRTNALLTSAQSREVLAKVHKKPSLWNMIGALVSRRAPAKIALDIRIAPFAGDENNAQLAIVAGALMRDNEIGVKILPEPLPVDPAEPLANVLEEAYAEGRKILRKEKADLLVWGEVNAISNVIRLRFISRSSAVDLPGRFLITDSLSLPTDFTSDLESLLVAVSVAAVTPRSEAHALRIRPILAQVAEGARDAAAQPPMELTISDQASIQMCYGNLIAAAGQESSETSWYRAAGDAYEAALGYFNEDDVPMEWANAQYHLGRVHQLTGEKTADMEMLDQARQCYLAAVEYYTKDRFPREWGHLQFRLGNVHYRLDGASGDTDQLKEALGYYQAALQVFNQTDAPLKWAEIKNAQGQVLQVWGDVARSPELIDRAVQACLEALVIRNREETPLPWAATQNNLGSALFMLGKMSTEPRHLEGAAEAFGKALSIYQAYGWARQAKVAERNMSRAEGMLAAQRPKPVPVIDWETEEERDEEIVDDLAQMWERQRTRKAKETVV
jgi:tetratricopeptide (TPR) repeat protein